jgi:hypothetical protein
LPGLQNLVSFSEKSIVESDLVEPQDLSLNRRLDLEYFLRLSDPAEFHSHRRAHLPIVWLDTRKQPPCVFNLKQASINALSHNPVQ